MIYLTPEVKRLEGAIMERQIVELVNAAVFRAPQARAYDDGAWGLL